MFIATVGRLGRGSFKSLLGRRWKYDDRPHAKGRKIISNQRAVARTHEKTLYFLRKFYS
jgi:hypothetical protein